MGHGGRLHAGAAALTLTFALVASACSDDESAGSTASSSSVSSPVTTTPSVSTDAPATTTPATTTITTTTPEITPTTEPAYPSTTIHQVPDTCDGELASMLAVVDESLADAQLDTSGDWTDDTDGATFDDRTHDAEEFRYRLGLDCAARLAQVTAAGDERMVVAAWTGDRRAWVVQATDAPETPYRSDQRVELFIDQPFGEWLVDQEVWAGTIASGETVIVGVVDTTLGLTAKSWWNEVPRFDDIEVTNAAERYAIDALVHAGNRNVSVGEPASFGVEIAAIQFITPLGLHLIATVAPPDRFDPAAPIVEGEMVVRSIAGVDVYVTTAVPESYAVGSVGWVCGDYVWWVDSAYGTIDELTAWTADLVESAGC